jgi:heterodisulfide reductase subunit B
MDQILFCWALSRWNIPENSLLRVGQGPISIRRREITREKLPHEKTPYPDRCRGLPLLFSQFDRGQMMLERKYHDGFNLPTFHISQLIGLAFGLDRNLLGLNDHRISLEPI